MTKQGLINKIKAKLEEIAPFDDSSFLEQDNLVKPITSYIEDALVNSCNQARLIIPLHLFKPKEFENKDIYKTSDLTGYVILPSDFLRLYAFRMMSWKRDVTDAISTQNPQYKLQKNRYTMGKPESPVCVINTNVEFYDSVPPGETKLQRLSKTLEYYSIRKFVLHKIERALYVPLFDEANIEDELSEFYSLCTCIDVLAIMGDEGKKKLMEGELKLLITSNTL